MKSFYTILAVVFLTGPLAAQPVSDLNGLTATGSIDPSLTLIGFSVPANSDRLLVACTENASNAAAPTLTFAGNPMTQAVTRSTTSGLRLALYYIPLGSSGSATAGNIVASGTSLLQLGAASYHDVDQADPTDGEVNTTISGTNGSTSSMVTVTSSASDLVCDCIGAFANAFTNFTVGGGQTQIFQSNASSPNTRIAMSTEPGAASVNMSWTINGDFLGGTGVHLGMNINAANPLPVELTSFKGLATRDGNQLLWQTSSERNNSGFEIYRSPDGLQWEFLAFVAGQGGSTQTKNYRWLDKTTLSGAHYYRLKQVDTQGGFKYSSAILLRSDGSGALLLYPNPAGDAVFYQYEDLDRVRRIQLYDVTGKLMQETAQIDGRLPLHGLSAGLYWLTLQTDTGMMQQRVWKQ